MKDVQKIAKTKKMEDYNGCSNMDDFDEIIFELRKYYYYKETPDREKEPFAAGEMAKEMFYTDNKQYISK